MRGKKNPPLEIVPVPVGAPITFDSMAQAYLEDYVLQRYKTLTTARARVEHLRAFFGGWCVEAITPDSVRNYQMHRRRQGVDTATVNRETSGLSRMFQLAIRRGQLERMPLFPKRLEENPPRDGFLRARRVSEGPLEAASIVPGRARLRVLLRLAAKRDSRPDLGRSGLRWRRDSSDVAATRSADRGGSDTGDWSDGIAPPSRRAAAHLVATHQVRHDLTLPDRL